VTLGDAGHTLKTGDGEYLKRDNRNSPIPEIGNDVIQIHWAASTYEKITPSEWISESIIDGRNDWVVSSFPKISNDGFSNPQGGVDRGREPIAVQVPHTS
jgi:hypothetical protein